MTLCKAYMGIEPHFDLWNYFHAQLGQGSDVEMVALAMWPSLFELGLMLIPTFPFRCLTLQSDGREHGSY
jgi:hypothetical protein